MSTATPAGRASWLGDGREITSAAAAGVPLFDFKENAALAREVREVARFFAGVSAPRPARRKFLGVL